MSCQMARRSTISRQPGASRRLDTRASAAAETKHRARLRIPWPARIAVRVVAGGLRAQQPKGERC